MLRRLVLTTALLLIPFAASAEYVTTWSFTEGLMEEAWRLQGEADTTVHTSGLRITAKAPTQLFRPFDVDHPVEAVEFTTMASRDTELVLLWAEKGSDNGSTVRLPFTIPGSDTGRVTPIDVDWFEQWNDESPIFALEFPEGSDVQLMQITLRSLGPFEKIGALWKSFWTFDSLTPYSVNFLWGPVLTTNPAAQQKLFIDIPPHGAYFNKVLYPTLAVIVVITLLAGIATKKRRTALLAIVGIVAAAWMVFDLRMGLEAVSYLTYDFKTYWNKHPAERVFRERGDFPMFLELTKPLLTDRDRYVFMTRYPYPLLGLIRHHTYPALPVGPAAANEGVDTWVIFERPDITLGAGQRLMMEGEAISGSGKMLLELRRGTFVFRTGI